MDYTNWFDLGAISSLIPTYSLNVVEIRKYKFGMLIPFPAARGEGDVEIRFLLERGHHVVNVPLRIGRVGANDPPI